MAEAGLQAQESLLDLREAPGTLRAAVQAGRCDRGGHGLLDELVHALARVPVQAGLGEQGGDALEAGFVAVPVAVCGVWREKSRGLVSGCTFE